MAKRLRQRIKINGEIKWVTGYSHQELLENALELMNASTTAEKTSTPQMDFLFSPYAKKWIALYKESTLKHTTLREYTTLLNKHILPVFGEKDIREITTDDALSEQPVFIGVPSKVEEAVHMPTYVHGFSLSHQRQFLDKQYQRYLQTVSHC